MKSLSELLHPLDISQLTVAMDWLFPGDRGHLTEQGRSQSISLKAYISHLVNLYHSGFRTPYTIQWLYNFLVKHNLWKKMK